MLLFSSKNCQFRNNSSLNNVNIALYVIAVPVRNVNKSGVRTNLETGGHVTFPPYWFMCVLRSTMHKRSFCLVVPAICTDCILCVLPHVIMANKWLIDCLISPMEMVRFCAVCASTGHVLFNTTTNQITYSKLSVYWYGTAMPVLPYQFCNWSGSYHTYYRSTA